VSKSSLPWNGSAPAAISACIKEYAHDVEAAFTGTPYQHGITIRIPGLYRRASRISISYTIDTAISGVRA